MAFDFTGKRAVVCGGSKGIGRSVALEFAKAGAAVSICARGKEALNATLRELGPKAHAAPCDLSDGTQISAYIEAAADALGGIDVLVNNASGLGMGSDAAAWEAGLAVDVMATVRASHAAVPQLERNEGSSIVNISSISGFGPSANNPAYAAVKAALVNYTASQAAMLAPKGIRANAVAPGSIYFPDGFWDRIRASSPQQFESTKAGIPFGRLGTPEEIANVVLFLASPLAGWVTGQTIIADGGQTL